ncbi:hypothetical protein GQ44DRAFT_732918 [Phaeosphaeriaceae sp. PMI808]|nr:hypothetical protein GQ44DRAFT_732918 [Phaeosphaeriaceae sp. PMI808]
MILSAPVITARTPDGPNRPPYSMRHADLGIFKHKLLYCWIFTKLTAIMAPFNVIILAFLQWVCSPIRAAAVPTSCALSLPHVSLPNPPPGSTVRLVLQGTGTQNYSCSNAVPTSRGAVASLSDITCFKCPQHYGGENALRGGERVEIGRHYFTHDLVPTFDIVRPEAPFIFFATKAANVSSPENPYAIDWLYLVPKLMKPNNGGIRAVYRVKTIGGLPDVPCIGNQEVPYVAEYWFFS